MVASGNLEEGIEIAKKATVYGEEKGGSPQIKTENKQKWQSGSKSGGKGSKGNWGPSGGPKGKVRIISGDSQQEVAAGIVMVVTGGASTSGGKTSKPNKQGKGPKGNRGRSPLQPASYVEKSTV